MANIVVVGSSNTDMVIKTDHIPGPGETILGGQFFMNAGGKGANQAVAAARLGGHVAFVARVGDDLFGRQAIDGFRQEGIDTAYVSTDPQEPSGTALIAISKMGENAIVVAPGANDTLSKPDIDAAEPAIRSADMVLVQLEIPLETVGYLVERATGWGKRVILNPAPARSLPETLYPLLFAVTPNESEAEILTNVPVTDTESARRAATILRDRGVGTVIITMGKQGAFVLSDTVDGVLIPTAAVTVQDTTAAGDTFNGALAVALANGKALPDAIRFANAAAAISVTRLGSQASIPYLTELANGA